MKIPKLTNLRGCLFYLLPFTFSLFPVLAFPASAYQIVAPSGLKAMDTPSDTGDSLLLVWHKLPEESPEVSYILYQSTSPEGPFTEIGRLTSNKFYKSDMSRYFGFAKENKNLHAYKVTPIWEMREKIVVTDTGEKKKTSERVKQLPTYYRLGVTDGTKTVMGSEVVTATPKENWFRKDRANGLVALILMFIFVVYFISKAQRNPNMFLRRIPGIDAVDEAVGRATEMGKPILYSTGYSDIDYISTICSVNILAHVAKKVAQYDSRLIVPCKWSVAMTVCQEVVREAYINAGRPDAFNPDDVFFIAGEQFSYTAGVDGLMVREKPAANFFLGTFAAEALLLAETGATTGAIQIAGTDSNYQIPFFVVACDYCLIGEELYAASAYLSRNPKLTGSLKAQDAGKIILFFAILLGTLLLTLWAFFPEQEWLLFLKHIFTVR